MFSWLFMDIIIAAKNLSPAPHVPSRRATGQCCAFWFSSNTVNSVLSLVFLELYFLHCFTFCWWFLPLNGLISATRPGVEVLAHVPKYKKCVLCLTKKICVLEIFVQAWVIVLLIVSSIVTNQHYMIHKISLNRNTHK